MNSRFGGRSCPSKPGEEWLRKTPDVEFWALHALHDVWAHLYTHGHMHTYATLLIHRHKNRAVTVT